MDTKEWNSFIKSWMILYETWGNVDKVFEGWEHEKVSNLYALKEEK